MILCLALCSVMLADALTRQLLVLPCEEAFEHYKLAFNRSYPTAAAQSVALGHFCYSHSALRTADFSHADFRFNNDTDKSLRELYHISGQEWNESFIDQPEYEETSGNQVCKWWANNGPTPLGDMSVPLPRSFDLREQGLVGYVGYQGNCGCCWAFAANAVLAATLARQTDFLRSNENYALYFGNGIVKSYTSVQYILMYSGMFCNGASFQSAVLPLANGEPATIEIESDFPFTGDGPPHYSSARPKIPESAWYVPFQMFWNKGANCYRAQIDLHWGPSPSEVEEGIYRLKSHIARGIVATTGVATAATPEAMGILGGYHEGYLNIPCLNPAIDHAIAFVGYGTINGTEVWILRNSWGSWWGVSGYAYFEIGSNTICCERHGVSIFPKHMDFNESTVYIPSKHTDYSVAKLYVRGKNGLEMDCDAGFYPGIAECLSCAQHTPHCGMCTKTECTQCAAGYHFTDGDRPTCVSCAARHCVECNPSYCCSCVEGFHLANGVCVGDE